MKLICKSNLSKEETISRLEKYLSEKEIYYAMLDSIENTVWNNSHIVVVCTDKDKEIFSIIASDLYYKLFE